jgi:hypothetical protein
MEVTVQPWFWPVVLGIVAIVVASLAAHLIGKQQARQKKLLVWTMSQSNVVTGPGQALPGLECLEIRCRGDAVPATNVARIILWADGTEAVPKAANLPENPLRIVLPDGVEALDVQPVKATDGAVGIDAPPNPPAASGATDRPITFTCLNTHSGFVIQVIHSGGQDKVPIVWGRLVDVTGPSYV